jgi:hypothetical protein
MKRQRSYVYHTNVLVPLKVAEEAMLEEKEAGRIEVLLIWRDAYGSSYHFSPGDDVRHIDALEVKMHVDKIIRSYPKPRDGEKQKSRIEGILCSWFEDAVCSKCGAGL